MWILTYFIYFILAYLTFSVAYSCIFCIAGLFFKSFKYSDQTPALFKSFAILVPAYKEDGVIVDTVKNILKQQYEGIYKIVVLADQLQPETLETLRKLPVEVMDVTQLFDRSSKARALNYAFQHLPSEYDIALILDADNHLEEGFLQKINHVYVQGYPIIQAHRTAKNKENDMAQLDAISEELNNTIFRKGHQVLGLPAALIGSGMAFDYQLYKDHMERIDSVGGEDKELELNLLKDSTLPKNKIFYLDSALVFDEKVSDVKVFTTQRTRWISAQILYGFRGIQDAFYQLFVKGNMAYFEKVIQFWLLPRLILLGGLVFSAILTAFINIQYSIYSLGLLFVLTTSLILALPRSFRSYKTLFLLKKLPLLFFSMLKAAVNFRKGFKSFLPTPHHNSSTK